VVTPIATRDELVSGWGRFGPRRARVARPDRAGRVGLALDALGGAAIPRGAGRGYGDVATGERILSSTALDRLLGFDPETGVLVAEAGVPLGTLVEVFLPKGWFPRAMPGTRHATLGGAVAADVHGKNHAGTGAFGDSVRTLAVRLASGERVRVGMELEPDLFAATVGGLGLTGVIEEVEVGLARVPSAWIAHRRVPTVDLADTLATLRAAPEPYAAAWIDARRAARGRGYVSAGDWAPAEVVRAAGIAEPFALAPPRDRALPFVPPGWALNRAVLAVHNARTYARAAAAGLTDPWSFFAPLDAIADWNRLYGRRGLVQHQCALPDVTADAAVAELLGALAASGRPCFLATLKRLGRVGRGMLSFPLPGITLALDLKAAPRELALMEALDAIVLSHGGRLYLAKDARASASTVRAMEGERLERFLAAKRTVDPTSRFASDLSRRLGWTP